MSELSQLLEDIATYRRDMKELKAKEKEKRTQKEKKEKETAEEMRSAAMIGMTSMQSLIIGRSFLSYNCLLFRFKGVRICPV